MEIEDKIKVALKGSKIDIYDIVKTKENGKNIFRVYITKTGGVNIDDCALVTKLINPILDIENVFNEEYNLEVSSPGIERKLKTIEHFRYSVGELAKVKLNSLIVIKGKILSVDNNIITIRDISDEEYEIDFDNILSASTYFEF